MPNQKISELTALAAAVAADELVIVDKSASTTKKITLDNLAGSGNLVDKTAAETISGAWVFNEAGADKDYRFEGDTDANLLYLDASQDNIGIGTAPTSATGVKLHIQAVATESLTVQLQSDNDKICALAFQDPQGRNGQLQYDHSADAMNFVVNGAVKSKIVSEGSFQMNNVTLSAAAANSFKIGSVDLTSGNTMLSMYGEGTCVGTGTPSADRTIGVKVNGTTYYILASTSAS